MEATAVTQEEKDFIQFVVETIHAQNKGYSYLRVDKIQSAARDNQAIKKYLDGFGNMEACLKTAGCA